MIPTLLLPHWLVLGSILACTAPTVCSAEAKQVVRGSDQFEMVYRAKIPSLTSPARLWLPFARSDDYQTVKVHGISTPNEWQLIEDSVWGNWVMALSLNPEQGEQWVEIRYEVARREKASYPSLEKNLARYLQPDRLVPHSKTFTDLAQSETKGLSSDLARGRALYFHTLDRMQYDKSGDGWGRGDAVYACDARTGNCTDFHAYFIALCRAIGLPARFAIGFTIPADTDHGSIDGYHCWAEFFADGKWIPVDISEADKHPELSDYYFGHHPANRFELSVGRDLEVQPSPAGGPFNFLVYPYLECNGQLLKTENQFYFTRMARSVDSQER